MSPKTSICLALAVLCLLSPLPCRSESELWRGYYGKALEAKKKNNLAEADRYLVLALQEVVKPNRKRQNAFRVLTPEVRKEVDTSAAFALADATMAEVADLITTYLKSNNLVRAEALAKLSLADGESVYGKGSPRLISLLGNLAVVSIRQKKMAEADALYKRALAIADANSDKMGKAELLAAVNTGQGYIAFLDHEHRNVEAAKIRPKVERYKVILQEELLTF